MNHASVTAMSPRPRRVGRRHLLAFQATAWAVGLATPQAAAGEVPGAADPVAARQCLPVGHQELFASALDLARAAREGAAAADLEVEVRRLTQVVAVTPAPCQAGAAFAAASLTLDTWLAARTAPDRAADAIARARRPGGLDEPMHRDALLARLAHAGPVDAGWLATACPASQRSSGAPACLLRRATEGDVGEVPALLAALRQLPVAALPAVRAAVLEPVLARHRTYRLVLDATRAALAERRPELLAASPAASAADRQRLQLIAAEAAWRLGDRASGLGHALAAQGWHMGPGTSPRPHRADYTAGWMLRQLWQDEAGTAPKVIGAALRQAPKGRRKALQAQLARPPEP